MKKIDITQIVLDVLTMHEDPNLECLHEEDYEEFSNEIEKRIKNHSDLSDVSGSFYCYGKTELQNCRCNVQCEDCIKDSI